MSKVSLPQGTRDFSADVVRKRQYIFNTIKNVFELYGFQPLETPAMENIETLMGKYGDEGDKLIFKILNNGLDNPAKAEKTKLGFEDILQGKTNKNITERALRYDLTIPFARYVAMNHGQLTFPFKRYQIQPVWRADRPQRGRYREFYQCDADVVGSKSLLNEVELTNIYATVFNQLKIDVEIKINSRKILSALAEICGGADKMLDITIAIDKLDKIGLEKVKEELSQRGLNESQIATIEQYLNIAGSNDEKISLIKDLFGNNEAGKKGIEEIEYVLSNFTAHDSRLAVDFTLARGLNYYTGIIFEIKAKDVQMGSIGGGGRYDDLTSLFGVPNIAGVGISFGVDRIYDVMEELNLFPQEVQTGTQVLFFNLGNEEAKVAYQLMQTLRSKGIRSELFHENSKLDKQFKYAEKKNIPFIIIIGSKEMEEKNCTIKNLQTGVQQAFPLQSANDLVALIQA
ncbi:histidine--tRNA ligase [Arachidicoccus ginsenosidimutans]|uniref:histidine--tRNA ligase n=1 Tax=Arachidicoccus sp. BS20 TaxID=1850526 RepID=UPI0007F060F3|nr:histidine--tRNA ligase [Arachidicoccus sp. BS20]ANI88768.1 histidine--tRNA ligase [Arachidicoccus sp. BS20]